jgi:hypothetical protein
MSGKPPDYELHYLIFQIGVLTVFDALTIYVVTQDKTATDPYGKAFILLFTLTLLLLAMRLIKRLRVRRG